VTQIITVSGIRIELIEQGAGRPLLFLHPGIGLDPAVIERLSARMHVIAPTHPGFGGSEVPKWFDAVDDLAYFYLDLLDQFDLHDTVLVGVSFGGWIAAEIAIKSTVRLSHLVLGNPVGIKVSSREHRDIIDIFAMPESEFLEIAYCDPKAGRRDYKSLPEVEVRNAARNREATARYAWSPYMHDPKLRGRLHRIRIPTLILWGTNDRILSAEYGKAYCDAIPGARLEHIDAAGHFPHVEQPDEFSTKTFAFIESKSR
jgi:pimeloyl-ACP methyl ester carboxylesterase